MAHNFDNFPELRNNQMNIYYFASPHKQITRDFSARVVKVHDGDTITVRWSERDFDFPVRLALIQAPELNEAGGHESQSWLENKILNKDVTILIDPLNRVGKWGRILGEIISAGVNLNKQSMREFQSVKFEDKDKGKLPNLNKILRKSRWLR